jgi:hypothetical protein
VYQSLPIAERRQHVDEKYLKEDLFGKHLDCNFAYAGMISDPAELRKRYRLRYLDLVLLTPLPSVDMRDHLPSMSIRKGHLSEATSWGYGEAATWFLRDLMGDLKAGRLLIRLENANSTLKYSYLKNRHNGFPFHVQARTQRWPYTVWGEREIEQRSPDWRVASSSYDDAIT